MWSILIEDPVAIYAAALSTLIAMIGGGKALWSWFVSGPTAAIEIINPLEVRRFDRKLLELVVSNTGSVPIVVREAIITLYDRRSARDPVATARFYHGAGWDPSLKDVPHPTKPNTTEAAVQVIQAGHEVHQLLKPFGQYDPESHWIMAQIYLRNRRRPIKAWAEPQVSKGGK